MRLWHYKLIPVLPNEMLVAQWRECIAIMRQWQKGTLKHRLVSYILNYNKSYFYGYVLAVTVEMRSRKIKYNRKLASEVSLFCADMGGLIQPYPEHNDRYLKQCYYNLQEKYDRGIITQESWMLIRTFLKERKLLDGGKDDGII